MRRSFTNFLLDAFDGVLGAEAAGLAERRQLFISAHLLAGAIGVFLWPVHWLVIGPVDFATGLGFFFLWAPLFLALWVRGGADLEHGEAASAFCLAGFVTFAACYTGGLVSPALPWLLIVPLEASISRRRSSIVVGCLMAGAGLLLASLLTLLGVLPPSRLDPNVWAFAYATSVLAALIVGTLGLRAVQRRSEQEAARDQSIIDLHRSLTENAADLITRHSADGVVRYASSASEDMLGLSARELEGLSPAMIVHIQDLRVVEQAFARAARGETLAVEFRLRRRDGTYLPVEMRAQSVNGEVVAVTRDISINKAASIKAEVALERAEESSRAKSRYLASVTHELRTPLNAIIGFADMMRNEVFGPIGSEKYKEYVGLIHSSGLHLVELVSDLLDMAKIEAGKFTIERKPLEVKPLVDECLAMVRGSAEVAGVELSSDVTPGVILMADKRALKQSLINLLSNAIKFTPADGRVSIAARVQSGYVVLEVADTGVGIPERDLARIGKPFEQVEGEMQRAHRGTGLGLSLVKALTELHGGTMDIESALGDGTKISLRLPITIRGEATSGEGTLVYPERFRARA